MGNPNHDKQGRFASGSGAGGGNRKVASHVKKQHLVIGETLTGPKIMLNKEAQSRKAMDNFSRTFSKRRKGESARLLDE